MVTRELGAADVMQVDFELTRRELLQRGTGGNVLRLADRIELREEWIDILDILHAAVLRAVLDATRSRDISGFRRWALAVRIGIH